MNTSTTAAWPVPLDLPVVGGESVPPDVDRIVDSVMRTWNTDDAQVGVLLGWKRYAYTVAAPVMAAWTRHRIVPDVSLGNAVVAVSDDEPVIAVSVVQARWSDAWYDLDGALGTLRAGHLDVVREQFRRRAKLGRRSFDALEASTTVAALGGTAEPGRRFAEVEAFLSAQPAVDRLVEIAELTTPDGDVRPMALRSACCLLYKVGSGKYCSTCNLIDDRRRTEQLAAHDYSWRRRTGGTSR